MPKQYGRTPDGFPNASARRIFQFLQAAAVDTEDGPVAHNVQRQDIAHAVGLTHAGVTSPLDKLMYEGFITRTKRHHSDGVDFLILRPTATPVDTPALFDTTPPADRKVVEH